MTDHNKEIENIELDTDVAGLHDLEIEENDEIDISSLLSGKDDLGDEKSNEINFEKEANFSELSKDDETENMSESLSEEVEQLSSDASDLEVESDDLEMSDAETSDLEVESDDLLGSLDPVENNNNSLEFDDDLEESDDLPRKPGMFPMQEMLNIEAQVEAIIFASEKSIKISEIIEVLGDENIEVQKVSDIIKELIRYYEERGGGFRLEHVRGGGYQFRTVAAAGSLMERMFASRPRPISRAAQETLAIIAYRQPVTRADVEFIRGVDAGSIMKNLLERDLIKCVGRKEDAGRPMMFGTTEEFLRVYQLGSLKDLPPLDSFQPSPENMKEASDVLKADKEVDIETFIEDADKDDFDDLSDDELLELTSQEGDEEFIEDNEGPLTENDLEFNEISGLDDENINVSNLVFSEMEETVSEDSSEAKTVEKIEGAVLAPQDELDEELKSLVEDDNKIERNEDGANPVTEVDFSNGDSIPERS